MTKETFKRLMLVASSGMALVFSFATDHATSADSLTPSATLHSASTPDADAANGNEAHLWAAFIQQAQPTATPTAAPVAAASQTTAPTAEQKYKNIQVLKGLPAAQLPALMHLFSTSLGVRCDHCHVRNANNEMEWDKDDKPDKKTARKMIQMTIDLNKAAFNNRTEVSCYTCHQGHDHPLSIPPLPAAIVPAEMPRPALTGMPAPEQILEQYVQAVGGKEAIAKVTSRHLKGQYLPQRGGQVAVDVLLAGDKFSSTVTTPQGVIQRILNGTKGWLLDPKEGRELDSEELITVRDMAEAFDTLKLKEPFPKMTFGGKDKINEREVVILRGALPDKRRVRLFFDTASGLLLRKVIYNNTIVGPDPVQFDFDDYQAVDGIKVPFTVRISYTEPGFSGTRKFTEIKHNVAVDETKFAMPKK
ncbi:MAG: c-type cytochrome [Acidobacteria bacterium]|nr:c-type cytochrome [Acidobacteriota bacterium]